MLFHLEKRIDDETIRKELVQQANMITAQIPGMPQVVVNEPANPQGTRKS